MALPTIQSSLHASLSDLQWVVDAYTLPFAVLLLTAGSLGDRYSRERLCMLGLALFTGLAPVAAVAAPPAEATRRTKP